MYYVFKVAVMTDFFQCQSSPVPTENVFAVFTPFSKSRKYEGPVLSRLVTKLDASIKNQNSIEILFLFEFFSCLTVLRNSTKSSCSVADLFGDLLRHLLAAGDGDRLALLDRDIDLGLESHKQD